MKRQQKKRTAQDIDTEELSLKLNTQINSMATNEQYFSEEKRMNSGVQLDRFH